MKEKAPRPTTTMVKLKILHMKRLDTDNKFLVGSCRCWLNGFTVEYSILRSKQPTGDRYWVSPPGRRAAGGRWIPLVFLDAIQLEAVSKAILAVWERYLLIATYHDLHREFPTGETLQTLMEDAELDSDPDNMRLAGDSLLEEFVY